MLEPNQVLPHPPLQDIHWQVRTPSTPTPAKTRLRILHVVHQYPPEYLGGTELYTQTVAQALSQRGHTVAVFTRKEGVGMGHAHRLEEEVDVHIAWNGSLTPARRFLATFGAGDITGVFAQVLDAFQPDLIHVQHGMGMSTGLFEHIRRREIPFIITLHDFWWVCANAQLITNYSGAICDGPALWLNCARCALARGRSPAFWPALPAVAAMLARRSVRLKQFLNGAARLIAPSAFVKDWYAEHGAPPDRITVLKHGIDPPSWGEGALTKWPGGSADAARPRRFLYAGGLAWQKGVHVLLDAFTATPGPAQLWIAGDENFAPEYSRQLRATAETDPGRRVRFLGKLSRAEIWDVLAQVDAVVAPALWYETFSLIVHEAFAAGVPVIASSLGALAEAVTHERDGLLVEPGVADAWQRALHRAIHEPELLAELRRNIRPPLSLNEHIDRLQALYVEAVHTHVA